MASKQQLSAEQDRAAEPTLNVWVQANAGTGKTSVLVGRLLRILFRSDMGQKPNARDGILCLTYTNAGAAEMRNRILGSLRNWAYADDDTLRDLLAGISHETPPTDADLAHAREIFYKYIDDAGMLKIRTIHSFCEEVLHRFPIEAGIAPSWHLIAESDQKRLMANAFQELINSDASDAVKWAFDRIVGRISEYSYGGLLGILTDQYRTMFQMNQTFNYAEQFIDTIEKYLKPDTNIEQEFFLPANVQNRRDIINQITSDRATKTQLSASETIKNFIAGTIDFDEYKKVFLTADGSCRKKLKEYMLGEQELVHAYNQMQTDKTIYDDTRALFYLSDAFTKKYAGMKLAQNSLDFDDIILYTGRLFSNPEKMGWVLSQLDSNLAHILVDEAQDTSPEQWGILRALATNFFTTGDTDTPRSLFVVGDTKQSIYSFQGANPAEFTSTKGAIAQQIAHDKRDISEIPLSQSFRSTAPILSTVDHFFNDVSITSMTKFKNNAHKCFRVGDAGHVELHPLNSPASDDGGTTIADENTTISPVNDTNSGDSEQNISTAVRRRAYITEITDKIQDLLNNKTLASRGTPIVASDIMILVQKRTPFVAPLVAELKSRGIAVAGSDRIKLPEFPAIRDLLNLLRFCMNTSNDYALACVLKSPLFRMSEGDLFKISHARGRETLFNRINDLYPDIYNEIQQILTYKNMAPYSFFTSVLNTNNRRAKMISALGAQIIDPLEEFLTICLSYERTNPGGIAEFMQWFLDGASEIKRDMETGAGVRIMTVHASKGLDSPIVFLIDTIENPKSKRGGVGRMAHLNENGTAYIWSPDGADSDKFNAASAEKLQLQTEEYYRLLYVAMTRARDQLYIYGFGTTKNPPELAWHTTLSQILPSHPDAKIDANGVVQISCPQTRDAKPPKPAIATQANITSAPDIRSHEINFTPEHIVFDNTEPRDLDSFFASRETKKFATKTGTERHIRLQNICLDDDRDAVAVEIKQHPELIPFFDKNARTEVPIAGTLNGKFISRRIDRMIIDENSHTIKFIDYKTDIDKTIRRDRYVAQMYEYSKLISSAYPDYKVMGYILWTSDWTIDLVV